jgi:hypothetical protein
MAFVYSVMDVKGKGREGKGRSILRLKKPTGNGIFLRKRK